MPLCPLLRAGMVKLLEPEVKVALSSSSFKIYKYCPSTGLLAVIALASGKPPICPVIRKRLTLAGIVMEAPAVALETREE